MMTILETEAKHDQTASTKPLERVAATLREAMGQLKGANRRALENALATLEGRAAQGLDEKRYRNAKAGQIVVDPAYPGLRLRVGVRSKIWIYRTDFNGKQREIQLGEYPATGLASAREKYGELREQRRRGSLFAEKAPRATNAAATCAELVRRYLVEYAQPGPGRDGLRSHKALEAIYTRDFVPVFGQRDPATVTRTEVRAHAREIESGNVAHRPAPAAANSLGGSRAAGKFIAAVGSLYSWALEHDLLPEGSANPAAGLKIGKSRLRPVEFSEQNIGRFVAMLPAAIEREDLREAFRLQLLSASRIGEIVGMRWAEVDLKNRVVTIPGERAKNGEAHRILLSKQAAAILQARSPLASRSEFVFPQLSSNARAVSVSDAGQALARSRAGFSINGPKITSHTLRHWAVSLLSSLGFSREIRDRVTNHIDRTSSDSRYNHHGLDAEAARAWQRLANKVDELEAQQRPALARAA